MEKVQQTIYGMPEQFRAIVEKIRESSPMKPIRNEIYLRALEIGLNQLREDYEKND